MPNRPPIWRTRPASSSICRFGCYSSKSTAGSAKRSWQTSTQSWGATLRCPRARTNVSSQSPDMNRRSFLLLPFAAVPAKSSFDQIRQRVTKIPPAAFADVTSQCGIHFKHDASRTSEKYLPESMGAGVAMFDYNNDGYLDLF